MAIDHIIAEKLEHKDGIWMGPAGGYWSNLDQEENARFLKELPELGAEKTVAKFFPQFAQVIFSPKRTGGLALLGLKPGETVVDVGCMWGALTVPLARAGCRVIGIDQTLGSLHLLRQRLMDEKIADVEVVCSDVKKIRYQTSSVDTFIVNGVLEWIPETGTIELKKYYGKKSGRKKYPSERPDVQQREFLKSLHHGLKKDGKLYLAIENRFDILHFFGLPDPHCNVRFITFMPRCIQHVMSKLILGRPYVNWTYSEAALTQLLHEAGFHDVHVHYTFPDYRYPEYILTAQGMHYYRPNLYRKGKSFIVKAACFLIEEIFFRRLRAVFFAPSFIVIARK